MLDVRILIDGQLATERLDGNPIAIDPGDHTVRFEANGARPVDERILLRQGEKNRILTVTFGGPGPEREGAAGPVRGGYWTGRRIGGAATGAAGVVTMGIGGLLMLAAKARYDEASNKTGAARHDDSVAAVDDATTASVVFGVLRLFNLALGRHARRGSLR